MKVATPVILLVVVHFSNEDSIKSVAIKPIDVDLSINPINQSAKQCGGAGKLIAQHNSVCQDSTPDVCKTPQPTEGTVETNFEPSKNFARLAWRVFIKYPGKNREMDHDAVVANSTSKKGQLTHLHGTWRIDPKLKGKFSVKFEIYDPDDDLTELCVESNFDFV